MDFQTLQSHLLFQLRRRVLNGEITERGLARISGLSQPHVHHVLKGARGLSVASTDRILHTLGLSVLDLVEAVRERDGPPGTPLGPAD